MFRDYDTIIDDLGIAMETDAQLQKTTKFFVGKNVLTDAIIDSLKYGSLEVVTDIILAFPMFKDRLIKQYHEKEESERANAAAWAKADMSNPSNR